MAFSTQPFKIAIAQDKLDELQASLAASRLPPAFYEGTRPGFGVTSDWINKAKHEWQRNYDWRKLEERLNRLNHFVADVPFEGSTFKIHFIHHKSRDPNAIPILIMHGWPGSFLEFIEVVEPLATTNFNVVVPSLPGFAFSQRPPVDKDFGWNELGTIMDALMKGLGYNEYAAQGGDIGSFLARLLGSKHNGSCKAVHQNMAYIEAPKFADFSRIPEDEQEGFQRGGKWIQQESAYAREHGTKPSTISHVLYSSPLALLAWIGEKFISWTDETPSLTNILDSVTLWYLTDTFPTSIYVYRHIKPRDYIPVPYGFTWNKHELFPTPLALVETTGNLIWYRKHTAGGHFFALERPEAFVKDIQDCFKVLWPRRKEAKL